MFDFIPLGDVAKINMGQSPDSGFVSEGLNDGLPFLQGNAEFGEITPTPRYSCSTPMKVCSKGDILVSVRAPVGEINIADRAYCIGRGLAAISFTEIAPRIGAKLIESSKDKLRLVAQGSTFEAINKNDLINLLIARPHYKELEVLDSVFFAIDTQIRQTEAIIAKLQQVKQGLLHDLLTRGIDANGQLRPPRDQAPELYKESPLGWIPRGWEVRNLGQLTSLITSGSRGWASYYSDTGFLFLRSQNIRMGHLDLSERQCVNPPIDGEGQRTRVKALDLLVTITGNGVGNLAYLPDGWSESAFVSQHVALVRFVDPWLAKLANHYLVLGGPGRQQIVDAQYGQSKPGLNLESLRNIRIPEPPCAESEEIIARVALLNKRVEDEVSLAGQLHSVKAGLMDDLLTGRVRVTALLENTQASEQES